MVKIESCKTGTEITIKKLYRSVLGLVKLREK